MPSIPTLSLTFLTVQTEDVRIFLQGDLYPKRVLHDDEKENRPSERSIIVQCNEYGEFGLDALWGCARRINEAKGIVMCGFDFFYLPRFELNYLPYAELSP